MSSLSIGLSGLQVNQQLLNLTGQNITNADTPGYHNEIANLAEIANGSEVGSGVSLTDVTRVVNQMLDASVNDNASASSNASTQLASLNQLQSYLVPGSGTLHDSLINLFSQLETLTTQPDDPTQRQVVLAAANDVTTQLNDTVNNLDQLSTGLVAQANTNVGQINSLTSQIAQLNQQVAVTGASGQSTNALLDQRDAAVASLSQLVDVRTVAQPQGEISLFSGGTALVLGSQAAQVQATTNTNNQLVITTQGSTQPLNITGGSTAGILTLYNTTLPAVQSQVNTFASALVTQFDNVQATGLGLNGPMTSLTSQRTVSNTNAPLNNANLSFPPTAGDLYITVTNLATGARTLDQVAIDPSTQSLADVASAINAAVPNVQAVVDPQAGTLSLLAANGYGFDFTGNLSSSPDSQAITGTTTASIGGSYTGAGNDTLTYTFSGAGTIGSTPDLTLDVRNSAGTLLNSLNVGQGYQAGSALTTVDGVQVTLASGTVNSGDTFSVNVAGNPDSSGLLPALGLNSFFTGNSAGTLQVNPNLLNDPAQLAASTTGQPGDGSNLEKMVALQTQPVLANHSLSLQQYLENIIGSVGTQVSDVQTTSTALTALGQQLTNQQQSVSGVDSNQALTQLVQYQQAYEMSAQYVSIVTQTLQSLFTTLNAAGA